MTDFLKLHPDYKHLLLKTYTAWLSYALILVNALDYGFWFFIGYAPVPQWAMGLISMAFGFLIPYARVRLQKSISGEQRALQLEGGPDASR